MTEAPARKDAPLVRGVGLRGAVALNAISMIGIGPLITIPLVLGALHGPTGHRVHADPYVRRFDRL